MPVDKPRNDSDQPNRWFHRLLDGSVGAFLSAIVSGIVASSLSEPRATRPNDSRRPNEVVIHEEKQKLEETSDVPRSGKSSESGSNQQIPAGKEERPSLHLAMSPNKAEIADGSALLKENSTLKKNNAELTTEIAELREVLVAFKGSADRSKAEIGQLRRDLLELGQRESELRMAVAPYQSLFRNSAIGRSWIGASGFLYAAIQITPEVAGSTRSVRLSLWRKPSANGNLIAHAPEYNWRGRQISPVSRFINRSGQATIEEELSNAKEMLIYQCEPGFVNSFGANGDQLIVRVEAFDQPGQVGPSRVIAEFPVSSLSSQTFRQHSGPVYGASQAMRTAH